MPLGELAAVRTRTCDSVSGIGLGLKTRNEATREANFKRDNLNEFESSGLFKKRSALGYRSRIRSKIEGPVSSNRLAPPTKQTAILDRDNSAFFRVADSAGSLELKLVVVLPWRMMEGICLRVEEEREKKRRREREEKSKRRNRQSRSDSHLVNWSPFRGLAGGAIFAFGFGFGGFPSSNSKPISSRQFFFDFGITNYCRREKASGEERERENEV